MPKHVLLCTTLRHFCSKQLRFGHCDNDWYTMELKQAIDTAMDLNPNSLDLKIPPELYSSAVHSEWENFNQYQLLLLSMFGAFGLRKYVDVRHELLILSHRCMEPQ